MNMIHDKENLQRVPSGRAPPAVARVPVIKQRVAREGGVKIAAAKVPASALAGMRTGENRAGGGGLSARGPNGTPSAASRSAREESESAMRLLTGPQRVCIGNSSELSLSFWSLPEKNNVAGTGKPSSSTPAAGAAPGNVHMSRQWDAATSASSRDEGLRATTSTSARVTPQAAPTLAARNSPRIPPPERAVGGGKDSVNTAPAPPPAPSTAGTTATTSSASAARQQRLARGHFSHILNWKPTRVPPGGATRKGEGQRKNDAIPAAVPVAAAAATAAASTAAEGREQAKAPAAAAVIPSTAAAAAVVPAATPGSAKLSGLGALRVRCRVGDNEDDEVDSDENEEDDMEVQVSGCVCGL